MTDATTARLTDARTILLRAALDLPECETKACVQMALAACGDALDAHGKARTQHHMEVLADALAAPGGEI